MQDAKAIGALARKDGRIIIHFDYDAFYASVVEHENPSLKQLPLAIQQKQIIVTCNYEARRRGLHKLQLIAEAKKKCPEVVIVLGEDISRFRDASKELYQYLKQFSWNGKVERLGFDEVWMDVTDIVEYNLDVLHRNTLATSFFQLSKADPTEGFSFDANSYAGHTYPDAGASIRPHIADEALALRLRLGSHLAMHLRQKLEDDKGYTSTAGISTSKVLSKLVGNLNKPRAQTSIVPPYEIRDGIASNIATFIDEYEIGKIPSIGFKLAQKLREHVLQRAAGFNAGLVYGGTKEQVTVRDIRLHADVNPEKLERLLCGPGSPHGIGLKVWQLLHGVDDSEVSLARPTPRQISIEDSYFRLDTLPEVLKQLTTLSRSLIARMRIDLLGEDEDDPPGEGDDTEESGTTKNTTTSKIWLAHPRTVRLSTRPRPPMNADGTRTRTFKRISHSAPLPNFIFSTSSSIDALVQKLVHETLIHMFRKLHPEKAGWNLSLVNVAVTNMVETAGDSKTASGRNIGTMFRRQEDVLKDFRVVDEQGPSSGEEEHVTELSFKAESASRDDSLETPEAMEMEEALWEEEDDDDTGPRCGVCGAFVPLFASSAHSRYHALKEY